LSWLGTVRRIYAPYCCDGVRDQDPTRQATIQLFVRWAGSCATYREARVTKAIAFFLSFIRAILYSVTILDRFVQLQVYIGSP
jgi:hypothetical protein